jgi:hypothetical protein
MVIATDRLLHRNATFHKGYLPDCTVQPNVHLPGRLAVTI